MNDIILNIIDAKTRLPHHTIIKNGDFYQSIETVGENKNAPILEQIILESKALVRERLFGAAAYVPDVDLGIDGEKKVLNMLENEALNNISIKNIEWVAQTKNSIAFGYDIEVTMNDMTKIGVEVKSTKYEPGNIFHITFSELCKLKKMGDRYYLVIVIFQENDVKALYVLKNPAESLGLNLEELDTILSDKYVNAVSFHALQYRVEVPVNMLTRFRQNSNFMFFQDYSIE